MIVLCIAYHNIAVEQEFLKQVRSIINLVVLSFAQLICEGSAERVKVPGRAAPDDA